MAGWQYQHLCISGEIIMYLSEFTLKTLVHSTFAVRLDYCNTLYYQCRLYLNKDSIDTTLAYATTHPACCRTAICKNIDT